MSRLLVMSSALLGTAAFAQPLTDAQLAAIIAKQRATISINADGCLKDPNDDEGTIIVCGEGEDNKRQKLAVRTVDNDRIRRGEGISSTKAAAKDNRNCGVIGAGMGCIELPKNYIPGGFGRVPPPAIPLEEIYRGLPEPDMIVTDGDGALATPKP